MASGQGDKRLREVTCWHGDKGTSGDTSFRVAGGSSGWQVAGGLCAKVNLRTGLGVVRKRRGLGIIKILALALALALRSR